MTASRKSFTIGLFSKRDLNYFTAALIMAKAVKYERLRFAKTNDTWFIKIPDTKLVWATWSGFVAGRSNRMGYMIGTNPSTLKWEKSLPAR